MLHRRTALQVSALSLLGTLLPTRRTVANNPTMIFTQGKVPNDYRLQPNKTLDGYFPFNPPSSLEEWEQRKTILREQVLIATGLWPMPEKVPLKPLVTGTKQCDGYTIENVAITSLPGHYVTGNLYRPNGMPAENNPRPGVLFAHGHWNDGRLHVASDAAAKAAVQRGEEADFERAKYFMQAIPITLAKLGFVVFQYDMVGYANSTAIPHIARSGVPHPEGFADAEGELRLQSLLGLQTWNSIRALDYLCSLPDVDSHRIGMTGASGGGSQTFLLGAIDDRIKASVPAVMVSTAMQGGCVCENCSLLRVNTGNIELAALFAPRPQFLPSANDWTKEILTKGYPELKQLYKLYGKPDNILAKAWLRLPHNYGRPSREMMYEWFLKHLQGKSESVTEPPFTPTPIDELRVFNQASPRPADELKAKELRQAMTKASDEQLTKLKDNDIFDYQKLLHSALRGMIVDELPSEFAIRQGPLESKHDAFTMHRAVLGRKNEADAVPHAGVFSAKYDGSKLVIWLHPQGKASLFEGQSLAKPVQKLVDAGYAVLAPDVLGIGEMKLPNGYQVNNVYAGYTFGYNRSLLAQRVHDVLTTMCFAQKMGNKSVSIIGIGELGPVAILTKAAMPLVYLRVAADYNGLDFAKITKTTDPNMLPGAVKYGLDEFLFPFTREFYVNADGTKPAEPMELVELLLGKK